MNKEDYNKKMTYLISNPNKFLKKKQSPYRHRKEETQYNHRDHQCRREQPQHNQEIRSFHTRIFIR